MNLFEKEKSYFFDTTLALENRYKESIDIINSFRNTPLDIENSYKELIKPLSNFNDIENIQDYKNSLIEKYDFFDTTLALENRYKESIDIINSFRNTPLDIEDSYKKLIKPLSSFNDIEKYNFFDTTLALENSYKESIDIINSFRNTPLDIENSYKELIKPLSRFNDIENINISSIFEKENNDTKILEKLSHIENNLTILLEIEKQILEKSDKKENLLKFIIITILIPIIIAYFVNLTTPNIENFIKNEPLNIKSTQTKHITTVSKNKRVVKANILNIRKAKSTKSTVIGKFFFGEVVTVLKKEQKWVLVKKYYENGEIFIQGWVYSKYLSKLN